MTGTLTVQGAGAQTTIVDAGGLDRVLLASADANLEIRGMTLSHGNRISAGVDTAVAGGGIGNYGTLLLTDSVVEKNAARDLGGGIFNVGTLALVRSAIRENFITDGFLNRGGGIYSIATTLTATDSTIADNSVDPAALVPPVTAQILLAPAALPTILCGQVAFPGPAGVNPLCALKRGALGCRKHKRP